MRPMTQAETVQVNAILTSSPPAPTEQLEDIGYGREALIGSQEFDRTIDAFLHHQDEINAEDLDAFLTHVKRSFPDREITAQICPDDDPGGILIFSIYGFTAHEQMGNPEEDLFYEDFPAHLDHAAGPVTIFVRTGPYMSRSREKESKTAGGSKANERP
ncbi:hypothetical protein ACNI65_15890 [Roseateles sp. So40a]|uniref:hypothetical protein n=1 Tax=Roseateles sp. So40a TaxID=3400226 RepID=UPI003A8C0D7B